MRQTLFRIPLDGPWSLGPLGEWPGLGFGIVLAVWLVVAAIWLFRNRRELELTREFVAPAVTWSVIAAAIILAPRFAQREFDRVIADATAVIAMQPNNTNAFYERAKAFEQKRNFPQAVQNYSDAIAKDPDHVPALRSFSWMRAAGWDAGTRDAKQALELAQKAVELTDKNDPQSLDALAAAQAESGKFDEAIENAKQAAVLASTSKKPEDQSQLSGIRQRLQLYRNHTPYRQPQPGRAIPIFGYGFMLVVGFFAAGFLATRLARRVGIDANLVLDLGMWVFFSGVVGARIFYCVQYAHRVFYEEVDGRRVLKGGWDLVKAATNLPDGGLVLYGGILAGVAAFLVYVRVILRDKKINGLLMADVAMPALLMGIAFGRLGCFMNGCCYGDRCDQPWAIEFPMGSVPDMTLVDRGVVLANDLSSMGLHPTQLYMSFSDFLLAALTAIYFRYRPRDGSVLAMGLLTYPVTRFIIEYLRDDELGQFNTTLTISQWVSVGLFVFGIGFLFWLTRRPAAVTRWLPAGGRLQSTSAG